MVTITLSRPFKILSAVSIFICVIFLLHHSRESGDNNTTFQHVTSNDVRLQNQHKINRVIAHLRTKYVANRTPYEDAPPLMILYSCNKLPCGTWVQRLKDITSAFFLGVSLDGTAYAVDMTAPIRMDWFFEIDPAGSAMTTDQAHHYLQLHGVSKTSVAVDGSLDNASLASKDLKAVYQKEGARIVQAQKLGDWHQISKNPVLFKTLKGYDLQTLTEQEWFVVARRFLFAKPSEWFRQVLEPYRSIMGGRVGPPRSLSLNDPDTRLTQEERTLYRIGVHITDPSQAHCLAKYADQVCKKQAGERKCYLFVSAGNADAMQAMRQAVGDKVTIRTVDSTYEYQDLDKPFSGSEDDAKVFYARVIMDWTILTTMDYLIGADDFIETAAWVAQVPLDRDAEEECQAATD
ncbi:hypothetical protein K450DRAFT_223282 [Umbelopsis ramanniana AG]|uniref:Uncharacterized protein n=1 Tax=Umbelopsis ramanniana AG TaxID=1314678 RepID=A0AAD5HGD5_UMBRA|nr:uncharacterized protein K450DRAFT_223282 [Umbelopsis ramanniana AG]KAI8583365.1 hypothetical protein K450DRAFT_223282 [Umbelopsis ramanniana AG]